MRNVIVLLALLLTINGISQTIPLEKVGRTYIIDGKVNGLALKFILDTGADAVSMSLSEAIFMLKNGYLQKDDLLNTEYYKLANGDISEGTKIILRKVQIGIYELHNVEASIVHELDAPLLLGQSVLERLGNITIDYNNNQLIVNIIKLPQNLGIDYLKYFYKAMDYYNSEDYEKAIYQLDKAISIHPSFYEAYSAYDNRGSCKVLIGDLEGAMSDYNKAISIEPNYPIVYLNRGGLKETLNDLDGAILDYTRAISLKEDYYEAYFLRGLLNHRLKRDDNALIDFDKVIELNENHLLCYYYRAKVKGQLGNYNGAISDINVYILEYPSNANAYLIRGFSRIMLGSTHSGCKDLIMSKNLGDRLASELLQKYCK